jgi:hypothetical protein
LHLIGLVGNLQIMGQGRAHLHTLADGTLNLGAGGGRP